MTRTCATRAIGMMLTLLSLLLAWAVPAGAHGGLHEQIAAATKRIHRDPRNPALYLQRAELYRAHGDWKAALADYGQVSRLDPGYPEIDFFRGRMYYDAGRSDKAIKDLDRFIATHPDHASGRIVRARVLSRLGRPAAAVDDYDSALSHTAQPMPELFIERAQAGAALGPGHLDEAVAGLDEGMHRLGPVVTLQLCAIELETRAGSYDAALARVDQCMAATPRKEFWLARRGDIRTTSGRPAEAREAYQAALNAADALPAYRRNTKAVASLLARISARLVPAATTPGTTL